MAKASVLKGISNAPQPHRRHSSHGTPRHKRTPKRDHAWMDGSDDDDLEVKRSKKHASTPSKSSHNSDQPRKKPRLSAPAGKSSASSSKDPSLQKQRKELPIYTGTFRAHSHPSCPLNCGLWSVREPGKDAIVNIIRENDVTVLIGETGSGKTTRRSPQLYTTHARN